MMLVRLAAVAGAGMAGVLFAATVYAAPADDQNFIAALDRQGIPYSSPQNAIGIAREVCALLDDGATGVDVAREINKTSGIPAPHAGYFVGASITSYCPSHSNAFSG
jgi:hypothetical protein